jgi:hypothetical protein
MGGINNKKLALGKQKQKTKRLLADKQHQFTICTNVETPPPAQTHRTMSTPMS